MNNEIKEILDIMKKCYDLKDENFDNYITLYQLGLLLDYITNLQQINDNLTTSLNKKIEEGIKLQQENEYLKKNNPEQNIEHFRIIKENKRKINNLREENKTLHENNQNMQEEMARVWEENEDNLKCIKSLKEQLESVINENQRLLKQWFEDNDKTVKLVSEKECYKSNYNDYKSRCEKAIEYNNQIIKDTKDFYRPTTDIIYSGDALIEIATNNINILQDGGEDK